jgi:hypothetical protein
VSPSYLKGGGYPLRQVALSLENSHKNNQKTSFFGSHWSQDNKNVFILEEVGRVIQISFKVARKAFETEM